MSFISPDGDLSTISTGFSKPLFLSLERLFREEVNVLGCKKSFSKGIGITTPKARTRDKPMSGVLDH
ncbi:hypothetical protein DITRI_Ditri05aG0059200 [Diplodiscus trichospermus]